MGVWLLALLPLYGLTVEEAFEKGNQAYVRGENALKDARKKSGHGSQIGCLSQKGRSLDHGGSVRNPSRGIGKMDREAPRRYRGVQSQA